MGIWQVLVTVFAGIGGGGAALAIAAWLLRTALKEWLARDAEAFKTRLKADADIEIERLKNSLQILAMEHQVRFSKLHETQAEVIGDLYKKIVHVSYHGKVLSVSGPQEISPTTHEEKQFVELLKELRDVLIFAEQNRIYLPEAVCALLDAYLGQFKLTIWSAGVFGLITKEQTMEQSYEAFMKSYEDFERGIPAVRKADRKSTRLNSSHMS